MGMFSAALNQSRHGEAEQQVQHRHHVKKEATESHRLVKQTETLKVVGLQLEAGFRWDVNI